MLVGIWKPAKSNEELGDTVRNREVLALKVTILQLANTEEDVFADLPSHGLPGQELVCCHDFLGWQVGLTAHFAGRCSVAGRSRCGEGVVGSW
jgi:hypothetical protein